MKKLLPAGLLLLCLLPSELFAQTSACPAVNAGPDVTTTCGSPCTNLTATIQGTLQTNTYTVQTIPYSPYSFTTGTPVLINIDDTWTPVINLPFCFQFFGNTYNQMVIGSNGLITFDLTYANGFCQWSFANPIPTNTEPLNSIMCPYHDIDPSIGSSSDIRYQIYGTAPCREFVVSWYNVPMFSFSCNSMLASQQLVLHENTNIIDMFIANKPLCSGWNGGLATEGIQNATGTAAFAVPGRNATQWTATSDGKRFIPAGAPNYTIQWSGPSGPIGNTATINVCPTVPTTYTCTITNSTCAGPIIVSDQVVVTPPPSVLSVNGSQNNILCNGLCTGSASVTVSGGTGPYTYSWAPAGGTGANATGLCPGTYTCTITDAGGCTGTRTFTITQPPALTSTGGQTNILCNGLCTGSATVTPAGGTGPYSYNWAPSGGTGSSVSGRCPGTYTCTITDANGCTTTRTFNITQPPALTASTGFTPAVCGNLNGTASVTPSGGTGPYTYSWAPSGGSGATASGLGGGTYTITVTDANGCTTQPTVTVGSTGSISATITSSSNVMCFGGNNGSATVAPVGGTGPYTYNWSPSGGTGSSAPTLTAGSYTVSVTDANGCAATASVTITQPAVLTATMGTPVNVLCNGGTNGSASVTAGGGTGPYTYNWAPSGGTGNSAGGLGAGTYTVTVTDSHGCTAAATASITQPTAVTGVTTFTTSTCGNANGTAGVTASGGIGPYTYNWAPAGGTGSTTGGVIAGNYTVTITDANGCTSTNTVNVPNAGSPTVTITAVTNVTCFGANNGTAGASAAGGTTPYSWAWSPSGGTAPNATNLGPASYTCTVTDANGCTSTASTTITEPTAVTASLAQQTDVLCFAGNTGTATVNASGGTGTLNYAWTPSGGGNAFATGLIAGTYTCTVTDANNCTTTQTVIITEPPVLALAIAGFDATCSGACDGQVVVIPSGGVQPYASFAWSSGCTAPSCNNMCIGTYTVTVTDANGCVATDNTTVSEPAPIVLALSSVTANCGQADGSATAGSSGGTGPYTYSWSPAGGTGSTTTGVVPGNYTVTVTDFNGCVAVDSVNVPNTPGVVVAIASTTDATCSGDCNGQATITAAGGNSPYTILWPSGGSGLTETSLCAGSYPVSFTDASGCVSTTTVTINEPAPLVTAVTPPAVICIGQSVTLSTTTSGGTAPYTEVWTPSGPTVSPTTTTTYSVVVTDANGCTTAPQSATVVVNPALSVVPSAAVSICPGASAALSAVASGGDGNYLYSWSPATSPATGPNVTASPGSNTTYTVTVSDGCGSPAVTATVAVTVYTLPAITFVADSLSGCAPLCVTFTNTTAGASSCAWDFGDNTTASANCTPTHCYNTPGSYDVTLAIIDANGCASSMLVPNYITVHPDPVADFTVGPQPTTILNATLQFTDQSIGAVSWNWNFGDLQNSSSILQNPSFAYIDTGCFDVTLNITNSFGCTGDTVHPICIGPDYSIFIPNAFTPNDDNKNDVFNVKGAGIDPENFEMWIFDRWGNMIYFTDDLYKGWNGHANYGSEVAEEDAYVWKIKCKDVFGNKHSYIGHLSLIK
jgi:gliding motility-associated-like protein